MQSWYLRWAISFSCHRVDAPYRCKGCAYTLADRQRSATVERAPTSESFEFLSGSTAREDFARSRVHFPRSRFAARPAYAGDEFSTRIRPLGRLKPRLDQIAKRPTGEVVYFESSETFERYRTM
jgi:hypothetical protein